MRFVRLNQDVSIQYWLEFIGEAADKVWGIEAELRPYIADVRYESERVVGGKPLKATARLYLDGDAFNGFKWYVVDELLDRIGLKEYFCKLQLRRENGARIVCFRPADENPALTGFGRTKPGVTRPCHQDFSETYVDRKPGVVFINYKGERQTWYGFNPLYLKVQPADSSVGSYYMRIVTHWSPLYTIYIFAAEFVAYNEADDIPQELAAYEFSQRGNNIAANPEQEKKNAEALEELFVRTRRPITEGRPGSNKMDKTNR